MTQPAFICSTSTIGNTRTMSEIWLKITIKTLEQIADFEQVNADWIDTFYKSKNFITA